MKEIKLKIVCLFVAVVMLTLAGGVALAATARPNVSVITQRGPGGAASMQVTTPALSPARLRSLPSGEVVVKLGELPQGGEPGDPMLPYNLVRLLVPPDADLATAVAKLVSGDWEDLPGEYDIAPAPPAAISDTDKPVISWGTKDESIIINGRDSTIYGTDAYFPAKATQIVSVGQFRQWKLVEFRVWMAAYNPVKKKVRILRDAAATLSVQRLPANLAVGLSSSTPPVLPGAAEFASQLLPEVDNPQDLEAFYGGTEGAPGQPPYDYVIITTSTIVANSTNLASFIVDKGSQGFNVKTVVEGAVQDATHYVTGATCDARANNIRTWLQTYWVNDGIQYVLLIGDPNPNTFVAATSIPMKWTWPRSASTSNRSAPSDMFFAELSNTWDFDGDGLYGEFYWPGPPPDGDYRANGCDKFCEVTVGRIPVYSADYVSLDAILQKSIDYRTAGGDLSWRAKVLIPAAISNFGPQDNSPWGNYKGPEDYDTAVYGDNWGQAIKGLAPSYGFSSYTLYEKGGLAFPATACNAAITKASVKAEWPNKYGFVTWWGHGNQTGAYRRKWANDNQIADSIPQFSAETSDIVFFQSADCVVLDDTCPSFVVQVSCLNGYPSNSSNLGYSLLKQGAVGTISGTRVTWYALTPWHTGLAASVGDNASYGYSCFDQMAGSGDPIGDAHVWCRANFGTGWSSGASWMNMVDLTLYGDPSLSLSVQQLLKWQQPPDDTQHGIDVRCDRSDGITRTLANDFNCVTTGPITKVTIWGSWFNDIKGQIKMIHLSIHSDNPMGPYGWSEPNDLLWQGDFYPADFTETIYKTLYDPEWFWDPTAQMPPPTPWADFNIWQYDISIDPSKAFIQQGDPCNPLVYWLDVYVELEPDPCELMFGWKSTYEWEKWNDDSVFWDDQWIRWTELRYPPGHYYYGASIDLAFAITTGEVVEPNDIKWSQPPVLYEPPDIYIGWDEESHDWLPRMVLDDFQCDSNRPVTAIRWWGSFLGWNDDVIPYSELPNAFLITIWDNVPAGVDATYSHPGQVLWGTICDEYDVNFYGWEYDPRYGSVDLAKFEFYQELDPCDYWYQPNDVNIYWLGIAARYGDMPHDPCYPWGWETREHFFEDDAVRFFGWPEPNMTYPPMDFEPIEWQGETWDLSFELISRPRLPIKPLIEHSKWSQPPIEIDPASSVPEYSGWDEQSFREWIEPFWYDAWNCRTQCYGDADCDGDVDADDETIFWNAWPPNPYDPHADFNRDDAITAVDAIILNSNMGTYPPADCGLRPQSWQLVADDFRCLGEMPVTSIHWWGSHYGWEQAGGMPSVLPIGWKVCFWSNVPASPPAGSSSVNVPDGMQKTNLGEAALSATRAVTSAKLPPSLSVKDIDMSLCLTSEECIVECPPGGTDEDEPDCGLPVDTVNGGCNSDPPVFSPISCGETMCGTAAWDGSTRDTDWYEIVITEETEFTWTVEAEFDVVIGLVETIPLGSGDCGDITGSLNPYVLAGECEEINITTAYLPVGTYWFFVAPDFSGPAFACGKDYVATLTCVTGEPTFSYPEVLLWQIDIDANRVEIDEVGTDSYHGYYPNDVCYQYTLHLEPNEWFWQGDFEPNTIDNVFWMSIAAIYEPNIEYPEYPWGWKTRPWHWMDDAVRFSYDGPLEPGLVLDPYNMQPIKDPLYGESFDVAFELDTDPNYIKWEQHHTGIRHWPHYEDELSMASMEPTTETVTIDFDSLPDGSPTVAGTTIGDSYAEWGVHFSGVSDIVVFGDADPVIHVYSRYAKATQCTYPPGFNIVADFDVPVYGISVYVRSAKGETITMTAKDDTGTVIGSVVSAPMPAAYTLIGPLVLNTSVPIATVEWWPSNDHAMVALDDLTFDFTAGEEYEELVLKRRVADDWLCERRTPVTAIVWWGSYLDYQFKPCSGDFMFPPVKPDYFELTMWDDVPANPPIEPFSHPNDIIWQYKAYDYDEVLVGYDKHPEDPNVTQPGREPVFRYSVRIDDPNDWFCQTDINEVFWFSVVAVYDENEPIYNWGWTNHQHMFNDNAVEGGYVWDEDWWEWQPLYDQTGMTEDMSFMLFTDPNVCCSCANYNHDWIINFLDYAYFANNWCWIGQAGGYNKSDLNCDGVVDFKDLKIFVLQWLNYCP